MLKRFSSASMPYNSTLSKRGRCPHIFVIGSSGKRRDFEETISGGGPWSQFRPHAVRAPIFHLQKKNTNSQPRQRLSKQDQCNAYAYAYAQSEPRAQQLLVSTKQSVAAVHAHRCSVELSKKLRRNSEIFVEASCKCSGGMLPLTRRMDRAPFRFLLKAPSSAPTLSRCCSIASLYKVS